MAWFVTGLSLGIAVGLTIATILIELRRKENGAKQSKEREADSPDA